VYFRCDLCSYVVHSDAELDRFCPVNLSVSRLKGLKTSGKKYEVVIVPGADHNLQKKSKDFVIESSTFDWLKSLGIIK